jgi:hypothetical protein
MSEETMTDKHEARRQLLHDMFELVLFDISARRLNPLETEDDGK